MHVWTSAGGSRYTTLLPHLPSSDPSTKVCMYNTTKGRCTECLLEYIYVLSIYNHTSVGVGRETYLHVSMLHGRVNLILHVLYIWFDGSDNTATMASMFAVFC